MFFSSQLREGPKAVPFRLFISCDISKRELDRSLLLLPRAIAKIFPWMQIPVVRNNIELEVNCTTNRKKKVGVKYPCTENYIHS